MDCVWGVHEVGERVEGESGEVDGRNVLGCFCCQRTGVMTNTQGNFRVIKLIFVGLNGPPFILFCPYY